MSSARIAQPFAEKVYQRLDPRRPERAGRGEEVEADLGGGPFVEDRHQRAGGEMRVDDEIGKAGDAETGDQRRDERLTTVGGKLTLQAHRHVGAAGTVKAPRADDVRIAEQLVLAELRRVGRRAVSGEIAGGDDGVRLDAA